MLLSELLTDLIYNEGSDAADQAKQMGLVYKGFGRWADSRTDKVTHKTDGGKLTKVDPAQTKLGLDDPSVEKDAGSVTSTDPETQARMKDKSPRLGAPGERETREKRFARREQTKTTVKDIADQIHNHDWSYDKSDDHSTWSKGEREENKLMDTIAKSGFTYSQTKQIFRNAGGKSTKHGTSVAGETFTTNMYKDVMRRRIQITKDVKRGQKGAELIPQPPTKWDAEKYDASYRTSTTRSEPTPGYKMPQKSVPDEEDRAATQPPGHAHDVAQLVFAKTKDEELARVSLRLSPKRRAELERALEDDTLGKKEIDRFKDIASTEPDARKATYDVKYAKGKYGTTITKSFRDLKTAKQHLSTMQSKGSKGLVSKGGNPIAKSGDGAEVVDVKPAVGSFANRPRGKSEKGWAHNR